MVFLEEVDQLSIDVPIVSSKRQKEPTVTKEKTETFTAFLDMLPMLAPFFLGFFLFQGLRASFPLYLKVKFGWDELTVVSIWGIISGSSMLIGAITRIPSGVLADRLGRLKAIYLGMTGFFLALLTLWMSSTLLLYLVGFLIVRVAMNIIVMASRGAVPDVPRGIGFKNGILASMVALGGLIGPFLLTSLLTWFDADSIFLAMLLMILLDFIVFQGIIIFSRTRFDPDIVKAHRIMLGKKKTQLNWKAARELLSPFVLPSLFLACIIGFVSGMIITIQPIYGFYRVKMSFLEIGTLIGISTGLNVVSSPIIGALNGKAREKPWVALSFTVIMIVTMFLYLWGQFYWIFVGGSLLFILGMNIFLVADITRIANGTKKEYYSVIFGFDSMLIMLFNSLGSFATRVLYGISPQVPFLMGLILSTLGLLIVLIAIKSSL